MRKTKVLVTGGMGFIGSHLVDALVKRGDEVYSVDDLSSGKKEHANPEAPNFKIDISDSEKLEEVFRKIQPEVVFHMAALARIQPSFENPGRYFQVNAEGTKNVLAFAKKYRARRIVYSASSSAYGEQEVYTLKEDMKLDSQSLHPYGSTKRMGEMLMRDMGKITGGPETVCLRYFNVYGPRQTTTFDGPYATVIGIFLSLLKNKKPLTIVPDGTQRRDFTWVGDVVLANLTASSSSKVGSGEIINVGTGKNYSIWQVAGLICGLGTDASSEELLSSKKCVMASSRKGEVRETLADISKAKELLGWEPKMLFADGINILKSKLDNQNFPLFK